jgi:hypothetical protein
MAESTFTVNETRQSPLLGVMRVLHFARIVIAAESRELRTGPQ